MSRKLSASFVHISLGDKNKRVGAGVERGETEIGRERKRERGGKELQIGFVQTTNLGMVFLSRKRDVYGA